MQKSIWKEKIGSKKRVLYWTNELINLPVADDDIIHWWGQHSDISLIKKKKNDIIVSSENLLYLNTGFGKPELRIVGWKDMYEKLQLKFPKFSGKIIGLIGTLWSEVNSDETTF